MKFLFIILTAFFLRAGVSAQDAFCRCTDTTGSELPLVCLIVPAGEPGLREKELYGQWRYGNIILNGGEVIRGRLLRYDGLTDQLLLDSKDPATWLQIEKSTIRGFEIESILPGFILHFRRTGIPDRSTGRPQDAYLQVLVSGRYALYARRKLVKTLEVNKIVTDYSYYLQCEDGTLAGLSRLSHNSFLALFPGREKEIRDLLKKGRIRVRTEDSTIQAVRLLNGS